MQGGLGGGTVSMRPGINAGESYVREVAAFMLVSHAAGLRWRRYVT